MRISAHSINSSNTLSPISISLLMSLGPATALGFARFSYALLLPAMAKSLNLNYVEAGALNVTNAAGYLLGALTVDRVSLQYGHKRVFISSMALIVLFLSLVGVTQSYVTILVLRAISGYFGALIFISGGALLAYNLHKIGDGGKNTSLAIGLYYGGAGVGTAISGFGLPYLLKMVGDNNWAFGWYLLSSLALVSLIAVVFALKSLEDPQYLTVDHKRTTKSTKVTHIWPSILSYGLFGAGYISFMTFIVAFFRSEGKDGFFISFFYLILGSASFLSAFVWSRPLSRLSGGNGLAATYLVVAVGSILPIVFSGAIGSTVSGLLFGLGLMASSTALIKVSQRNLSASMITKALGISTAAMALGQIFGPLLTGTVSDRYGVASGMLASTVVLVLATLTALFQSDIETIESSP